MSIKQLKGLLTENKNEIVENMSERDKERLSKALITIAFWLDKWAEKSSFNSWDKELVVGYGLSDSWEDLVDLLWNIIIRTARNVESNNSEKINLKIGRGEDGEIENIGFDSGYLELDDIDRKTLHHLLVNYLEDEGAIVREQNCQCDAMGGVHKHCRKCGIPLSCSHWSDWCIACGGFHSRITINR